MSHEDKVNDLRKFVKDAKSDDWEIMVAGQRVQIIKKDAYEQGVLKFGTEVVSSRDGSITCLLGASPGASTVVYIMLEVSKKALPGMLNSEKNQRLLKEMAPTWNTQVNKENFTINLKKSKEALQI